MKVIFLIETYYPFGGSTALIAKNIIDEYSKSHSCVVFSLYTPHNFSHFSYPVKSLYSNIFFRLNRFFNRFIHNNFGILFSKKILNEIKHENPDLIISFIGNLRFINLVIKLNRSFKFKYYLVLTDPVINNLNFTKVSKNKVKSYFYKGVKFSEKVLIPQEYSIEIIESLKSKFLFYKFPLLVNLPGLKFDDLSSNDEIVFTYSGTFYNYLRDPQQTFTLFLELNKTLNFKLYILGPVNPYVYLPREKHYEYSNFLIYFGNLDLISTNQILSHSNILVNIGNHNSIQIPGKMITYLSFNKPILSFSSPYPELIHQFIFYTNNYPSNATFLKLIDSILSIKENINFSSLSDKYKTFNTIKLLQK